MTRFNKSLGEKAKFQGSKVAAMARTGKRTGGAFEGEEISCDEIAPDLPEQKNRAAGKLSRSPVSN